MPTKPKKVATLVDIAQHAGVSRTTASRVINQHENVKPSTRDKVEASIRALGFIPNISARNLASAKTIRICFLTPRRQAYYFSECILGALAAANELGAYLLVERFDATSPHFQELTKKFHTEWDALIVPPPLSDMDLICKLVERNNFPAAFIGGAVATGYGNDIRIDDFCAAHDVVLSLIARGHVRIGFVKGHPNHASSEKRYEGYCQALADQKIPLNFDYVEQGFYSYRSGIDAGTKLISLEDRPTAIFASNDNMAAGVVAAAGINGLSIPRDLSVVGFDDSSLATTVWPNLTTVSQPLAEMGAKAVQVVHALASGRSTETASIVMPYELIERDSVATPLARARVRKLPPASLLPPAADTSSRNDS